LSNPPANSISPQLLGDLKKVWEHVEASDEVRALVVASANPMLYCAGADIKSFTKMDEAGGRQLLDDGHALLRSFGTSSTVTIAAVNALAFGGGCELAMACDVRIAADSATFGQPEINLGIIPGFGGHSAPAAAGGRGQGAGDELDRRRRLADEAYEFGLVNRVVADHELFDTALAWARKLGGQAPLAVEQVKAGLAQGRPG
jgi:enoyl-CoA hydratase/3-hydroxyacyl-CoA dehydrogenase